MLTMLTRLNAVSTFSLMGFMLQYVEGMMVSFYYLFISALLKEKRLLLPSEKESNPPVVSCQCLTSWNMQKAMLKMQEVFPSLEDVCVNMKDVICRICVSLSLFRKHKTGKKLPWANLELEALQTCVFLFMIFKMFNSRNIKSSFHISY